MTNGQEATGAGNSPKKSNKKNDNKRRRRRQQSKQGLKPAVSTGQQQKERTKKTAKNFPVITVPKIKEPVPICVICGKPIEAIAQAICGPQPDAFNHFDCVLRKIEEDEHVMPKQKVSYIGKGVFAIIETDEEGKFVIVKRIPFESSETFTAMKRFVEEQKR